MSTQPPTLFYTKTDEAPALATRSWLPVVRAFAKQAGIEVELKDISLAGRILAQFADRLPADQQVSDALAELGELAKTPAANIIKLPNISASIPQLTESIGELQAAGFAIPDFPANPSTEAEQDIRARYAKALGSAVNPVLREGNSDRRVAVAVKEYARKNPHSMGDWASDSKTNVASMPEGDFFGSEQSVILESADSVRIEHVDESGTTTVLRESIPLQAREIIDSAVLSAAKLQAFLSDAINQAKEAGTLFSLHMKATMMKVSDPIIFGHAVNVFYSDALAKHQDSLATIGFNPKNGIGDLYAKLDQLEEAKQEEIKKDIEAVYVDRPALAMVDSDRGITNLHVPSDIIIDASMPAAIRASGKMWGPDGKLADTLAVIPDRSYSAVYQATIDFCKKQGAFDVTTMGNVANVGLMAQKAEEYGSHDKTFEMASSGSVRVVDSSGKALMEHKVEAGDIFRMCQTKDAPVRDWVRLAVSRAQATGAAAVFWLNADRAHDANLIARVHEYLPEHDTDGLDIQIMPPAEATVHACHRAKDGLDTISVTGNVLRDYLTDLFPILELGTSAKMLSIVPLLAGGGLFETGAGGSAPKHVQQFVEEGHLRWDSLGEFLALAVSLEDLATKTSNDKARVLASTLENATCKFLDENKSPSRKVNEIDTRGSHFYMSLYWAQELATQTENTELQAAFKQIAESLECQEDTICSELLAAQGSQVDIGGYYAPDDAKADPAMRPSSTWNQILKAL
ncbi:MAG: NADP-dependent isocitrate dehydrogenase [Pirellulaceae bacterium]